MRHVLIMILRLRQLCAHATLLVRKDGEIGHHDECVVCYRICHLLIYRVSNSLLLEAGDDRLANQQAFHDDKDINREDEIARVCRHKLCLYDYSTDNAEQARRFGGDVLVQRITEK